MPPAVVMPTGGPPVGGHGLTAGAPGLDVVDLAILGRLVAQVVEALPVSDLHGPAGGAVEEPPGHAHVDDPGGCVEDVRDGMQAEEPGFRHLLAPVR